MNAHLLIAEDSATQRALLISDLEAAGYTVTVARDGQEALELLHSDTRTVDLVISDIVMPRLDGLELCRRIKADSTLPRLPVVLLTSLKDPLDIVRGLEVGADNFLTKPYEAGHLVGRVQAMLANRAEQPPDDEITQMHLLGQRFVVTAERQQILELLVGAFEDLVHANQQLRAREQQLAEAQADLAARLAQVEHERARLAAVLDAIPDGILIVGPDGCITDVNPSSADLWSLDTGDDMRGTHVRDLPVTVLDEAGRPVPPSTWPLVRAYRDGESTTTGVELTLRSDDGRVVPVTITAAPIPSGDGPPSEAVAVIRDVSVWAFHDRLTALPNRILFADRLERALARARAEATELAVLVLALDRFTVVHDSLGREAEDTLVLALARRLVGTVRTEAAVARLTSDRFAILLDDVGDVSQALRVAERVAGVLARPVTLGHEEVFLTTSIGIVTGPGDGADAEVLLRQASTAMHRALERGGDRQEVYDETLDTEARRRLFLDAGLRRALEQGEFVVYFQPVASLDAGGRPVETEALVRWQHPEQGLISPAEFIPLAEESGLIVPLGRWVLEQACHQTQRWRETGGAAGLRVSVNLSARQFEDPELEADVAEALTTSGLPPAALTLEVTESALIQDPKQAAATLEGLRRLGVRVAIDDFGTGYSSLSYLRTFPLDVLKIDRTFVQQIGLDAEATAIVQAIITLARSLGLDVIAEGVETRDQFEWLHGAGCELMAGFYLCRPLPPTDLELRLSGSLVPED